MERISILIADDHPVVRQGLRAFLDGIDDLIVVGEAADGREAVAAARELVPDVVLMDLVMPGIDGVEATRQVRESSPSTRVIVLTTFVDDDKVFPAIKAGAAGYLLKDIEPHALAESIRRVSGGEALLHPTVAARLMEEVSGVERGPAGGALTERELEVLREIARGMSNKQIAKALGVSEKTVKTHVSNILAKLHLADRTQAAVYAFRVGLAGPDPSDQRPTRG